MKRTLGETLKRRLRVGRFLAAGLLLSAGVALGAACGEEQGDPVEITAAEWAVADGGPRIVVRGEWPRGVSTPPRCQMLEGPDRQDSQRFVPDTRTSLDGGTFSKVFVPESPPGDPPADYYVRCSITIDPGSTLSDTAPVSGSPPL